MIQQLNFSKAQLDDFCQRWKIARMALFGSVLREDFRPDSDVDVLVSFSNEAHYTLLDLARMESELEKIFGRKVDLVELSAIEKSRNYIRRKSILSSAETIYAR
jgi:predicted nucleotidyltransferase